MNCELFFSSKALSDFKKLERSSQFIIKKKLDYYLKSDNPMTFAKPLVNLPPATYRFRVMSFRIKFYKKGSILYITGIDHRKNVYK